MRGNELLWMLALSGAVALAGCSDGTAGVTGFQVVDRQGGSQLTVSGGITPTLSWSGGPARRILVRNLETGQTMWEVEALDAQIGFNAPVTQGVVPTGAREVVESRLLESGTRFEARVTLLDGFEARREFQP